MPDGEALVFCGSSDGTDHAVGWLAARFGRNEITRITRIMDGSQLHDGVGAWLDALASAAPAPGGGAAAAIGVSMGASLVCMVCNLTIGRPKYAAFEELLRAVLSQAEAHRRAALQLAQDDATAFDGVIAAYKLPKGTAAEVATRQEAIQQATLTATMVPLRTAELAAKVITLSGEIVEGSNKNVVSDAAAAALAARGALETALLNVETNLVALTDTQRRETITADVVRLRQSLERADAIVADVRRRITR